MTNSTPSTEMDYRERYSSNLQKQCEDSKMHGSLVNEKYEIENLTFDLLISCSGTCTEQNVSLQKFDHVCGPQGRSA